MDGPKSTPPSGPEPNATGEGASSFWTLPNVLTLARFLLAPSFVAVYQLTGARRTADGFDTPRIGLLICLGIVALAEATDFFDGLAARRCGQVSDFGKLLDPYADSVYRLSCFFCFASEAHGAWVPLWAVLVLFYRDVASSMTRVFALRRGVVVAARSSGKIKAWAQGATMIALLLMAVVGGTASPLLPQLGHTLMLITAAVAALSGVDYIVANRRVFVP